MYRLLQLPWSNFEIVPSPQTIVFNLTEANPHPTLTLGKPRSDFCFFKFVCS